MSKKTKEFNRKVKIIRKQIQKFCFQCLLPCSVALWVATHPVTEQPPELKNANTQVVA
ncbi:hypothetical protein ABFP28_16635 [Acinetobacter baumannii]